MPRRRRRRGDGTVFFDKSTRYWVARYKGRKVYAKTERVALQELERLRRAHGSGVDPATGTLDVYLADWLRTLQGIREATRVSYAGHINNHISPLLGGIHVTRLRPSDIRRLVADRLAAGLSPATVRRVHSTLHAALAQGVRERTLADNAAAGISLPKAEDRLVEAMTPDAADAVRDAVAGTFLEVLTELLLGSGLRLGEALGLDQGDVIVNAPKTDSFYPTTVVMVRRSKTRVRAVVISDDAAEALRRHISTLKVRGPKEPIFVGPRTGERLRGTTVSHAFPKMLEAAGLPRMNPHLLRHGSATLMVAQGVPMKIVSEQLGHRSIQTTDRFYAHVAPSQMAEAVKLLNRRVK